MCVPKYVTLKVSVTIYSLTSSDIHQTPKVRYIIGRSHHVTLS